MQKKILIMTITLLMISSSVLAYSDGFSYMLNNLNINKQNVNGYFVNEEIYNKYNLIVYGSPLVKNENQRWKESPNGNWTKNGGPYNGSGVRGEYWILRRNLFWKRST